MTPLKMGQQAKGDIGLEPYFRDAVGLVHCNHTYSAADVLRPEHGRTMDRLD